MCKEKRIEVALGKCKADLVLKNGQIINVFSGELQTGDVAIVDGVIAGVGSYSGICEVDLQGKYLSPGFINTHCHVESSMVTPPVYCMEELRWGVTTLITDPHEIANVAGAAGVAFMLEQSKDCPVNYFVQVPSCVPCTPFEHTGDVFTAEKMKPFLNNPRVLGLGEMMNYVGLMETDPEIMEKLRLFEGRIIDGHAPGVSGKPLQAYCAAGIHTDHESTGYAEALEKLRSGLAVLVREGSACKNARDIMTGIIKNSIDTAHMAFCTDDKHLVDIHAEGTIRYHIKTCIELGMNPITAIQMATINGAKIFGLRQIGAIAPGYRADITVLEDLREIAIHSVYKDGKQISYTPPAQETISSQLLQTVHLPALSEGSFDLPQKERYPVINLMAGQITTTKSYVSAEELAPLLAQGKLSKIAVIERHHATGAIGLGLLSGYGIQGGAVATTVAHDSHNLIVVGDSSRDMLLAVKELEQVQGGYTIVEQGNVLDTLPLPVGGLMSDCSAQEIIVHLESMTKMVAALGVSKEIDPFITLSFMALPVIPEIRITDMGVFDTIAQEFLL